MSLIFSDIGDRRKREKRGPASKKLKRKRGDFDAAQATPEKRVERKLLEVMKEVTDMTEKDIRTIISRLSTKPGFGHMNPELLTGMILLLQRNRFEKPRLTDFSSAILDPILRQVLPKAVTYGSLSEFTKNNLYASIFRYINWYFDENEIQEAIIEEDLEEENLREIEEEETPINPMKLEESLR